jgi:hypothetical protein
VMTKMLGRHEWAWLFRVAMALGDERWSGPIVMDRPLRWRQKHIAFAKLHSFCIMIASIGIYKSIMSNLRCHS